MEPLIYPVRNDLGKGTGEVLTEFRREEALLKTGALQNAIFNSANFSSIATDEKGVIQIFNVGAERMLGYTAADVVNRITPADISDPHELVARAKALSLELATPITQGFEALVFKASRGIEDIYELTYIRKDGSRFPDSGIGIEPQSLDRIFEAFEQERHIAKEFGGLGLGLAISKKLVELHGGTIAAFSEGENQGASFRLVLPRVKRPARERPEPALPGRVKPCEIKMRILLVEDNGDTVRILKKLLERQGHEVREAGDVATALELARRERFDLLVSDLGLPDRSGLELMRELRAEGKLLPGIALSGYGQEQDVQQSRDAGFQLHLVKPVNVERLRTEVLRVGAA